MKRANLFTILACTTLAVQAAPPEPALRIRFCDEVGLPETEFSKFRDEVAAALSKANVEANWVYCSVKNPAGNPAGCREALKPEEIVVRLLAKANKDRDQALGVSMAMKNGTGVHSSLHFAQIVSLAERARVEPIRVLALIALHEMGHLLMGPNHYPVGIMQSHWNERQLDETLRGDLFFTQPQAAKLQSSLVARSAPPVTASN